MLPKGHILTGIIFSVLIYFLFQITVFQATLIFLSSVLIDFDHYLWCIHRKKDPSLKNAYYFLKRVTQKKHKPMMMLFHTIEFSILIFLLSYLWPGFFFILIGMLFHCIVDIIHIAYYKDLSCREFSLIRYLILRKKYPNKYF